MMVTRNYRCPRCERQREATALGMKEPDTPTCECGKLMLRAPNTVAGFKFRGEGFHCVDYPKSPAQLKKDYGLDKHDSTDPNSDYHQDGYAEEMVSKVPRVSKPKG